MLYDGRSSKLTMLGTRMRSVLPREREKEERGGGRQREKKVSR